MRKVLFFSIFFTALIFVGRESYGQSQTFSPTTPTNSSQTFTVPPGVTSITVEAWGAGGRAGSNRGGGGGGGGYTRSIIQVTPAQVLNLYVGRGSTTNAAGENSYFINASTLLARGGNSSNNNNGANGGVNGIGNITFSGGRGADGKTSNPASSGGGGSSAGTGVNGNYINATISSIGATAPSGGGDGGQGRINDGNGGNGVLPGGGGGGGFRNIDIGGAGANGQIKISWCTINLTSATGTINQSKCIGEPIVPITYAVTGVTGITSSNFPTGVTANFSGNSSSGTITISGAPNGSPGVYPYVVTLQGNCTGTTLEGSIRVAQENAFDPISEDEFCVGGPIGTVTQATFGATGISTPTELPPGINVTWKTGQIEFTGTPTATGTYNYSIPLTGGCGTINATGTMTIYNVLAVNNPQLGAQAQCVGTPFTALLVGTGFGFSYQWFENTSASNVSGTSITGANSNTYTPSSATAGTEKYYYVEISGFCGGLIKSNPSGKIETLIGNTVNSASSSPTVCINTAIPTITHTTTGATQIGSPTGLPTGVTATWNANTITITGNPTQSGIFNYNIPLTGGCGTVSATGTITVNAQPVAITTPAFATNQSRCINASPGFNPLSVEARSGFNYQWYQNTSGTINTTIDAPVGTNSNSYTPLNEGTVPATSRYYVVVSSNTSCGSTATSPLSGNFVVNPLPVVSFDVQPSGTQCVDTNLIYSTQSGQSNYSWTIPGVVNTDYTVSGATTNSITIRWLTPGDKSISVNYRSPSGCTALASVTSNTITVEKNTAPTPSTVPITCFTGQFQNFVRTTTGATGIANDGVSGANGLPLGLSATWSGNASSGIITISGTVDPSVTPGRKNYSIPLTGGCSSPVFATGSIDVEPEYQITSVTSIAPSNSGGVARVTITGNTSTLPNGIYTITYNLGLANSGTHIASVTITNGKGTFSTVPITNDQLTSLTITNIQKASFCPVQIVNNNQTFFGFGDLPFPDGGIFFVPAGITEITVKVWGGGGGGGRNNGGGGGGSGYSEVKLAVTPGSQIYLYVGIGGTGATGSSVAQNGQPTYVSRTPNPSNPTTSSVAYAAGGSAASGQTGGAGGIGNITAGTAGNNGTSISPATAGKGGNGGAPGSVGGTAGPQNNGDGSIGTLGGGGGGAAGNGTGGSGGKGLVIISYPLPPVNPCFVVLDDGARSGNTVIEFTCSVPAWQAPEGLIEFTVTTVGGGGGGGMGKAAGGGGAGGFAQSTVFVNAPFGLPANSTFNVTVGSGGLGAPNVNARGGLGGGSSITGLVDGVMRTIAPTVGGGGGGSTNSPNAGAGESGASGGGGAYDGDVNGPDLRNNGGNGSSGFSGGGVEKKTFTNDLTKGAAAGGGGGGAAGPGTNGAASGAGNAFGGNGGAGLSYTIEGTVYYRGGGGGGNGFNFEGESVKQSPGTGGLAPNASALGGNGVINGIGVNGVARTGSGGGSGTTGGGNGGSGRVFITYPVFRILPIEYLYFNTTYSPDNRTAQLNWATSQEWENSHFEIERSVNGVTAWTKIAQVQGQGYSELPTEYTYTDAKLPASGGIVYYRLKQVDFDGSFSYSVTKSIKVDGIKGQGSWIAYPNPSSRKSTVTVDLLNRSVYNDEPILIQISDIRGVSETFTINQVEAVSEVVNRYMERSISGVYILQLIWGNNSQQLKLLRGF